jgi:acylphosphatase
MTGHATDLVRAHVWATGRVQGVGFRAHVEHYARKLGVKGWVRNVGYDTVETVAEGEREKLDAFVQMVKQGPGGSHVDEAKIEWENPTGEFRDFGVRRSL